MKYRNIYKLIDAIKKEIPQKWKNRDMFLHELDDVVDSANYRAPEAYLVNFEQLSMVLYENLGEPDTKWKQKIADIFADKIKVEGMTEVEI